MRTNHNVADGLTKTVNQQVLRNMLTTLKIELLETTHKQLSTNLIMAKSIQNELMSEQKLTPAAWCVNPSTGHMRILKDEEENMGNWCGHCDAVPREHVNFDVANLVRRSKCWAQEHREGLPRKLAQEDHDGWPRKLAQEDHDGWPRTLAQEDRDGWPRKLAQEDCDGWPRKLAQEDCDGWPRKLAQEDRDGWPRKLAQEDRVGLPRTIAKLKRERTDLRDGSPGKIEKVVMHEQKQVEKVVMHEQEKVEKILKGSRRVDGVLWRHRSHIATRRSHMRESNMGKQFHPVMHNMRKPCCVVQNIGFDSFIGDLSSVHRSVV